MAYKKLETTESLWDLKVQFLKGVGEKLAAIYEKAGITTLWDLLLSLPRTYEDRRRLSTYAEIVRTAENGQPVLFKGEILRFDRRFTSGRPMLEATFKFLSPEGQDSGVLETGIFTWFNDFGGSTEKRYPPGTSFIGRGRPQVFRGHLQFVHPELQTTTAALPEWEFGGFVPVYREISGLSTRVQRKIYAQALDRPELKSLKESLPAHVLKEFDLPPFSGSLREIHFPKNWEPPQGDFQPGGPYFRRLVFEELFMMALALHLRRSEWREAGRRNVRRLASLTTTEGWLKEQVARLPFALTGDQAKVLSEVFTDLRLGEEKIPMHRLVQGDVGSGKTIVAFLSVIAMMESGYQAVLMVPTEILAQQHLANFQKLFPEKAAEVDLLIGAKTDKRKREIRERLKSGELKFAIGTQALLTDDTGFDKLGLVIVDEQHRFGVEQRLTLRENDEALIPHLLVMTATPIPRSLALTLYGDLNISIIREKPPGRTPIKTYVLKRRQEEALVERLKKFMDEGRQIYLIYPLVEESEDLDLKDVQNAFLEWKSRYPSLEVGLLHGRLKAKEKERVMTAFKDGIIRILVSTTVIEVGVDVPNASVIIIEHAERFGLSQLHQLRGRVGRGSTESFCVLVGPDKPSMEVEARLKIMEQSEDGFWVAEKDLELRGPGEFLGRRQSGLGGFRLAHILRDLELMERAREAAKKLLEKDPRLESTENAPLRENLKRWWGSKLDLTLSG